MIKVSNDRQVLFLQSHRLSAMVNDKACDARSWPIENNELPQAFTQYLLENNRAVFDLLVDLAEEECHLEILPSVSSRDKKHCAERYQQKHFSNSLLSLMKYSRAKRPAAVLVSGVSGSSLCEQVLAVLSETQSALSSIHSPVTLAPRMCKALQLGGSAQLLVMRTEDRAYRLIACVDSFVVMNRRVEFPECEYSGVEDALIRSIEETLIYLERKEISGWALPKVNLIANFLCEPLFLSCVKKAHGSSAGFELIYCPIDEDNEAGALFTADHSAGRFLGTIVNKGSCGYEKQEHKRFYNLRRIRQACIALALSLVAGAVSTTAIAKKVGEQHAALSEQYAQYTDLVRNAVGPNELDYEPSVEAVRQALVTAKFAEMRSQDSPSVFLSHLSTVIGSHPTVSIAAVSWERQDLLDKKSLQSLLGTQEAVGKLPMELVYKATVTGAINGNASTALDTFDAFVSTLRQSSAGNSVVVVEAPFGMSQNAKTTAADLSEANGHFIVEMNTDGGFNESR